MAIRMIVKHPDPVLREKAHPVKKITPNVLRLLDDLAETMYDAEGVGLAAPQVGITKRLAVVNCGEGLIEMINPEIISKEGFEVGSEGCLSIPGVSGDVQRYQKVTVRCLDRDGQERTYIGEGLLARAFQHEIDHLNGVLFIDLAEKIYNKEGKVIT